VQNALLTGEIHASESDTPSIAPREAVPAALLAVLTELAFELLQRFMAPRHLLQKHAE